MFGSGGKETLVHLRNCFEFASDGPLSLGPTYYPLSEVQRIHERSDRSLELASNDSRGVPST